MKKLIAQNSRRVADHSPEAINRRIRQETVAAVESAAEWPETINPRLDELDREWDVERVLQTNASTLALSGLLIGVLRNPRFFWFSGAVLAFLFQHSVQGWCPPLPILRRLGIRTTYEIERERQALKCLRGDYGSIQPDADGRPDVDLILRAVELR